MKKPKTTRPGTVTKVIQSPDPVVPEKAEIAVKGADPLYSEIRVENILVNEEGKKVKLRKGSRVEVTIEAEAKETVSKGAD